MISRFRKIVLWVCIVIVTGLAAVQAAQHILPYAIMKIASNKMFADAGVNILLHAPQITHESRQVVRPSPDLAYSICGFDLSEGPLHLTSTMNRDNYWSVSAYGSNTDNFWVLNNSQIEKDTLSAYIVTETQIAALQDKEPGLKIIAPSETGVILFRNLVALPEEFTQIDQLRRLSNCRIVSND